MKETRGDLARGLDNKPNSFQREKPPTLQTSGNRHRTIVIPSAGETNLEDRSCLPGVFCVLQTIHS